ncbi:hypothetical protein [Moraxella marmotae]|uniref:hypothetical protein n=1 Tax=Moraxella marmotae TaxID=3344520 RepID=UPI0035F3E2E5
MFKLEQPKTLTKTDQTGKAEATIATASTLNQRLENNFDEAGAKKELGFQTQITTEFGKEAPKRIGDYAQNKELELLAQGNNEEAKKWDEGGVYRVALHTATAVLATGNIEGMVSAGGIALVATGKALNLDTRSTAMAMNAEVNNRQLHIPEKQWAKTLYEKAKREGLKTIDGKEYTLEQFEDALRLANHSGYNENYNNHIRLWRSETLTSDGKRNVVIAGFSEDFKHDDFRIWMITGQDEYNNTTYIQNLGNLHRPDENLVRFIKMNDKNHNYSWVDGWVQPYKPTATITTYSPKQVQAPKYPQSALDAHNTAVSNGNNLPCGIYETVYCRQQDQKAMESMTNASYFIPGGKYLRAVTETLAFASKVENEGLQKAVIGEIVPESSGAIVRTKQTSAIIDQMGVNDAITDVIHSCLNQKLANGWDYECKEK